MSRKFVPWGTLVDPTFLKIGSHWQPNKDAIELAALGLFGRNQFMGGDPSRVALSGEVTGNFDLLPALPFDIDNSNNQISSSTSIIVQVRFFVRVTNAGINVTPRIWDITAAAAATISGATASSGTATDFSGTGQSQTIALTLPNARHTFKPQLTIGGTPAAGYLVYAYAMFDCFCNV